MSALPGRLTRTTIHCEAGEAELRLSAAGNWSLMVRGEGEREWRLACSGDLVAGAPVAAPCEERRHFGKLVVDLESRRAFAGEREVRMTRLEFGLLAALSAAPARVFSKQELLRSVWGCEGLRTRTVESHASRVRVKLREAGASGYVVGIKGFGYKLMHTAELPRLSPRQADR